MSLPTRAEGLFSPSDLFGPALFAVADALSRAADIAPVVTLMAARTLVAEHLTATGALAPLSLERFIALWARFDRYADRGFGAKRVADVDIGMVRDFVSAPTSAGARPSAATSHLRRTAVRLLFRVLRDLRLATTDPTLDLVLPPRTQRALRPLTDEEVELCRWGSLGTIIATRRPAVWALAEAGAATAEVGNVVLADLDLETVRVWFAGSAKTDPRWARLTDWGAVQLARRVRELGTGTGQSMPVTYEGAGSEHSQRTSSVEAIKSVLLRAGVAGDRDVHPRSVTAWAGCRVLSETGRIDEVARRLGLRSLDLAADLVGFDWKAVTDPRSDRRP